MERHLLSFVEPILESIWYYKCYLEVTNQFLDSVSDFSMSLPVICALKPTFNSVKWQCKTICECHHVLFPLTTYHNFSDTRIPIPRQWLIKITQYSCGFPNLAPVGCLQYFYGSPSGVVKSFNFDGGMHLANQVGLKFVTVFENHSKCRI